LLVSGFVEAFITPAPLPIAVRLVLGAGVWLGFIVYVVVLGRAALERGETGDVAAYEREATAPTV
jgi:hypothetical protein